MAEWKYFVCFAILMFINNGVVAQLSGPGVDCICLEEIGHGELINPTVIGHASDGSGRLFVGEQRGFIWIYLPDGSRESEPFLNMTTTQISIRSVGGLLNFAFHPNFVNTGQIYLHYTAFYGGKYYQRISEMTRSSTDPNVIDPSTERILLDVHQEQLYGGHQGGGLIFGADGYLYITYGDGHCCNDPLDHAQNKSTYHGSVLRVDVNTRDGNLPYGIPPSNPFLGDPDTLPEIFSYGLRNPYTTSMDTGDRVTGEGRGRIFVGDVGEDLYEELNQINSGDNYGWPMWEALTCHLPDDCFDIGPVTEPLLFYNRTLGNCILVGAVYRGCMNPDLDRWMLFVDYQTAVLFGATEQAENSWTYEVIPTCETCPAGLTNTYYPWLLAMGTDEAGEHYFSAVDFPAPERSNGSIYKFVDPNNPGTPCDL